VYLREDVGPDGLQSLGAGQQKIARLMMDFFKAESGNQALVCTVIRGPRRRGAGLGRQGVRRGNWRSSSAMDVEWVRRFCMALLTPRDGAVGRNLVFKIGGKIYAMAELEDADHWVSFKCSPEDFAELCEREGSFRPRTWRAPSG